MPIFGMGKKKEVEVSVQTQPPQMQPQAAQAQTNSTVDEVIRLRQQGASNSKIIETLQKKGYKTHQIFDALNQAELARAGDPIQGAPYFDEAPQAQAQQIQDQPETQEYGEPEGESYDERIEELTEAIIEEKWNDLLKDINKIIEWKNTIDANMKALEQRQQDLKQSFDNMQKALVAKINDYDQNITNVGTELKALEKVFQKILPTFTENVNELSRAVKEIKKAK